MKKFFTALSAAALVFIPVQANALPTPDVTIETVQIRCGIQARTPYYSPGKVIAPARADCSGEVADYLYLNPIQLQKGPSRYGPWSNYGGPEDKTCTNVSTCYGYDWVYCNSMIGGWARTKVTGWVRQDGVDSNKSTATSHPIRIDACP